MATFNVIPDSFSDGLDHTTLRAALNYITTSAAARADIIDVGRYSTQPGAAYVLPNKEENRVVPVITGHLLTTRR
jgi:dihydropteroate synthase